jgi:hypothetical protein
MTSPFIHPQVIHEIPGRVRLHLNGWSSNQWALIESRLVALAGVRSVQGDPRTCNILILFDAKRVRTATLLEALEQPLGTEVNSNALVAAEKTKTPSEGLSNFVQLLLVLAEIATGLFVIEEIKILLSSIEATLRIGRILKELEASA